MPLLNCWEKSFYTQLEFRFLDSRSNYIIYIYIIYIMLRYMHAPKTDKNRYVSGSPRKGLGLLNQGHLGSVHTYIYIYTYLEPVCPLFWGLNPNKVFSNQNRGHLSSVCIYIYMYIFKYVESIYNHIYTNIYRYIPRTQMTFIFEGQPP